MISFLFAVLGSVGFWAVYFILSIFVATITLKIMAKRTFSFITGGVKHRSYEHTEYYFMVLIHFVLWPLILAVMLVYLALSKAAWPSLCKAIVSIDKMVPTVEFKKGKKEEKDG